MNPIDEIKKDLDLATKVAEDYEHLAAMAMKTKDRLRWRANAKYWHGQKDALHMVLIRLREGGEI